MSVTLVRVDARLIHGQVVEGWIPSLGVTRVVVADAEAAADPFLAAAMGYGLPPSVELVLAAPEQIDWVGIQSDDPPTLVLVRNVEGARAVDAALGLAERGLALNVGVLEAMDGRVAVTAAVHLSAEDLLALEALARAGVQVEIRGLPRQAPMDVVEARQAYDRAAA